MISESQYKQIAVIAGVVSAIGVVVTIVLYFENKEYRSTQKQIAGYELEIKKLDLAKKKREAPNAG